MDNPKKPCVYALYIPGGGVFGLKPAMMLEYLRELTDIPTCQAFPVQEAVSTGAIIVAGLNIPDENGNPKYTESQTVQMYKENAPRFFPPMPGRTRRLAIFNTLSHVQRRIDPLSNNRLLITGVLRRISEIRRISRACDKQLSQDDLNALNDIRKKIRKRWISNSDIRFISRQTKTISDHTDIEDIKTRLREINDYAVNRETHNGLKTIFHRAAFYAVSCIRNKNQNDIHYDPKIPQKTFQKFFGETRISDLIASVYISTYDVHNEEKLTFYSRKWSGNDFNAQSTRSQSRIMPKTWDAVMASIATQLAYPAHRMESGHLTEDWAVIHNPQKSIDHVIDNLPQEYDFRLVIMGTGDNKTPYYDDHGTIGNLLEGRTLRDMLKYTNSDFRKKLVKRFGPDSVIEFNPRMAPRTIEEHNDFPDRDMTIATDDQIDRIIKRTNDFIHKPDTNEQFKKLAMDIVENAYHMGQISYEHMQGARERCGLARIANDNRSPEPTKPSRGQGVRNWLKGFVANTPKLSIF